MKKVALFLSAILVISFMNVSFASGLYDKKKSLDNTIEEKEKKVKEIEKKKEKVQNTIFEVVRKKNSLIKKIEETKKNIKQKEEELDGIQKDLKKAIKRIKKQEKDFSKRVKAMYDRNNESTLEMFFKSDGINDFINRLDFAKEIAKQDKQILDDYKAEKDRIKQLEQIAKEKIEELNVLKEQQDKDKTELVAIEEELKTRAEELQAEIDKQRKIIKQKKADLDGIIAKIQDYETELKGSQAYNSAVSRSISASGWTWPLPGEYYISSGFGMRYHPILNYYYPHDGLDIPGNAGEPIVAAKDGVVVSTGWMGSYGKAVIISHGGGVSTIYAHASVLYVSPGQHVSAGETIAGVGTTGRSTGNHLHFGVSINGRWVHPLNYVSP